MRRTQLAWLFGWLVVSDGCGGEDAQASSTDGGSSTGVADSTGASTTSEGSTSATTGTGGTTSGSTGEVACDARRDAPDAEGIDEDGDGIDGVACRSIFVNALAGDDGNDGLGPDDPVATIARGIELAATHAPPFDVLVASAKYEEQVTLVPGVSVYGGYDAGSWERDVFLELTTITSNRPRTIIAESLDEAVELDGFTIEGASFVLDAVSTYAIWVRDTPNHLLRIEYCTIEAGDAGRGADAEHGSDGADGGNGGDASEGMPGAGGSSACSAVGGTGGSGLTCPATDGGDGQAGGDPTPVGSGGVAGTSGCDDLCDDVGTDAPANSLSGSTGTNGTGGTTARSSSGSFDQLGAWVPPTGTDATRGLHGSGGGGGGAGGHDIDDPVFCLSDSGVGVGGGGGGGGGGGCGGEAGANGRAGGGSFGLVAIDSTVSVRNTRFLLGTGGDGGAGGDGGHGGSPGTAGSGASGVAQGGEPGNGASGAPGESGGAGGGGAGGCGGASVGIASVGNTMVTTRGVSFEGGTGAQGGPGGTGGLHGAGSQAPAGEAGCIGLLADRADY